MILNVDHNPTAVTAVADQRGIHVAIFSVSSVWYSVYAPKNTTSEIDAAVS